MKKKATAAAVTETDEMKAVCVAVDTVAADVKLRVPKGATFLRATTAKGGTQVVAVGDVTKGQNVLFGAGPYKLIEAGVKAKNHVFVASEHGVTLAGSPKAASKGAGTGKDGGEGPKAASEGKGGGSEGAPKATREPKPAKERVHPLWEGHTASSLIRWMGSDGWKYNVVRPVINQIGLGFYKEPAARLQIASGRQGIRGEIAKVTEAQAKTLRGLRDEAAKANEAAAVKKAEDKAAAKKAEAKAA